MGAPARRAAAPVRARAEPAAGARARDRAGARQARPRTAIPRRATSPAPRAPRCEGNPISQPERLVAAGEAAPLDGSTVSGTIPVLPSRRYRAGSHRRRLALVLGAVAAAAAAAFAAASLIGSDDDGGAPSRAGARGPQQRAGERDQPRGPAQLASHVPSRWDIAPPASRWRAATSGSPASTTASCACAGRRWTSGRRCTAGRGTGAIASGFGSVWISYGPGRSIERVDPRGRDSRSCLPCRSRTGRVRSPSEPAPSGAPASGRRAVVRSRPDGRRGQAACRSMPVRSRRAEAGSGRSARAAAASMRSMRAR